MIHTLCLKEELKEEFATLQSGSLYIDSMPAGESIYIDNVLQTTTPATITGLSAGSHTYKLTLSGYQDVTGSFSIVSGQTVNVLVINGGSLTLDGTQTYDYINIVNGGKLYVTAYNGTGTTGTLILNVTEINVDSTSSIIGTARGYRGGGSHSGGEPTNNGGGGAGSYYYYAYGGGGGGGYGSSGGAGSNSNAISGGIGGTIYGTLNGQDINMGAGAGGGGCDNGYSSTCNNGETGLPGGAMLTINAVNITVHGTINFDGGKGGNGYNSAGFAMSVGGGGGAAGGGILFDATDINISNAVITANGGIGGCNNYYYGCNGAAGTGGGGRIKIFCSGTLIGTGATISAGTVFMPTPPNITATNMTITPSETPCMEGTCTVTVGVTWTNQGGSSGTFIPNISIDGIPSPSPLPVESLDTGASIAHSFSVTGLLAAVHTICPYPN